MQIDVYNDGSVKTVHISDEELLRDYEYVCESSECDALAFNGDESECPVCHNRDCVVSVEQYLSE